jgi:hypothetical protein
MIIAFLQKIESGGESNTAKKTHNLPEQKRSGHNTSSSDLRNGSIDNDHRVMSVSAANELNCRKVGEIFLNMIYFYGFLFDYGTNYIHTYVSKLSRCHPFYVKKESTITSLMILNPFDHNLIITKSFKKTANMKQTLKLIYNNYFTQCSCDVYYSPSFTGSFISFGKTRVTLEKANMPTNLYSKDQEDKEIILVFTKSEGYRLRSNSSIADNSIPDKGTIGVDGRRSTLKTRLSLKSTRFINAIEPGNSVNSTGRLNEYGYKIQSMFLNNFI